eukprot:12068368-Alexandrium_andersonii.AAC.1
METGEKPGRVLRGLGGLVNTSEGAGPGWARSPHRRRHSALLSVHSQKPSPVPPATGGGTAGRDRGPNGPVWCAGSPSTERLAPRRGVKL